MRWRRTFSSGPEGRLARKLWLARLALFGERLWRVLLWPVMVAGLFVLLVVTGLLPMLSAWVRWGLMAALAGVALWRLWPLRNLRWPTEEEGLARLERASGLAHQPLRTLHDAPAVPENDPQARSLWQAHLARLRERLKRLRAGWPRSDAPRRDPFALRFALALALVAAFALQGGHFLPNLRTSLQAPVLPGPGDAAQVDAWLDPPAFLRRPPVALTRQGRVLTQDKPVVTAAGSRLVIRVSGSARQPVLYLYAMSADGGRGALLAEEPFHKVETGAWQLRRVLRRPVVALLTGPVSARWAFAVTPDLPPQIELRDAPATAASGALVLRWRAQDDHGVRAARALFRPVDAPKGMLRYDPPRAPLRLPQRGREVKGESLLRLMAHPWAGMPVEMMLEATDVAGQTGRSKPHRFVLPERPFANPLARAIVEQRRYLVLHPARKREVAEMLAAFLAWPVEFIRKPGSYLGLRLAMTRLLRARTEAEMKSVVALLWEIANDIEDGDLAAARQRLEAARKALRDALARGAPPEEIARRLAELKQALNDFMRQLAQRQQGQPPALRQGDGRVQVVRPQDLQQMLKRLEDLARSGARDAAERLLSQLDNILENLQLMPPVMARPGPEEKALGEMQKLMREQQKLMDRTWQRQPAKEGGKGFEDLRMQQRGLAERLRELMERMPAQQGAEGKQAQQALRQAERAMRGAEQALRQGKRGKALVQQRKALQALGKGARRMAKQLARRRGMGTAGLRPRYDPLGRPMRGRFADPGADSRMIPNESATERARRILEALRKRAEDATRPPLERNYYDRLLRGLY